MEPKQDLLQLSSQVGQILTDKGDTISTAESCTGGILAHVLTAVSGASGYYIGGVVAYSNAIKEIALGVNPETLIQHGAVSAQTAQEMADGIRHRFMTTLGLSTTGIAGPTGGTPEKPVGLVFLGLSTPSSTTVFKCQFSGERGQIQNDSVRKILQELLQFLESA
jgi:PncC family amidohydrolase